MYLIKNGTIHQSEGKKLTQTDILVEENCIRKIGKNMEVPGATVIDASGMEVFPGMILPATSVGLIDYTSIKQPDSTEWGQPVYPQLSVRYSLDMREVHLQKYEQSGITAFGACPGNKALIAGQTGVFHTYGNTAQAMEIKDPVALKANFISDVKAAFGGKSMYPMTRMGMAALLRKSLQEPEGDGKEVLEKVRKGELPLLVNVYTAAETETVLSIAKELGIQVILQGVYDLKGLEEQIIEMKDSVKLLIGDLYSYGYAVEFDTDPAAYQRLIDAGVTVGLSNSGDNGMNGKEVLLWSAMKLVAQGMDPDTVMDMMTEKNAQILGVADKVGRLEEGMLADLVIWSANPVKTYQAQAVLCMADGQVVFQQEAPAYERKKAESQTTEQEKKQFLAQKLQTVTKEQACCIRGAWVHGTGADYGIKEDVLIRNGKIEKVGTVPIASDVLEIDAAGMHLLPGFVDAHCHQGGFGMLNPQDADLNEMTDPVTPQVKAIDAIDIREKNFQQMHKVGVTDACITPGSGNVICGQAFATKTWGGSIREMAVKEPCALKLALGGNPKGVYGPKGQMPMTRMGVAAVLFDNFEKAAQYKMKKDQGKEQPWNEKYEAMLPALNGEVPLKIHCEQFDMLTAIELAKKYGCRLTIEHAWQADGFYNELKESGCFVNFGPVGVPEGYGEMTGADLKLAAELERRGVPVSLITDAPIFSEDVIYTQMGEVIRDGIPYERVLKMVTETPAKALGIEDRAGKVQVGLDADLCIFSNLPGLDADAVCELVFIEGNVVYQKG